MNEALKNLLRILLNNRGEVLNDDSTVKDTGLDPANDGSSPDGKGTGAASAGDGKHGTPAGQDRSDFIPRDRFDKANSRAKMADELEEALAEHRDKLYRDPVTGKLKLRIEATKPSVDDDDDKDDLTEDEKLVFDEQQWKVIEKRLGRLARSTEKKTTKNVFSSYENMQRDRSEREGFFAEASTKFPDLKKDGSEFQKEYLRILQEEFTQVLPNGQKYTSPRAIQDASIKAAWILREREEKKSKELEESNKMNKQNGFVSKSSKSGPEKKGKLSESEFAELSDEDQRAYMEEEFNRNKES